MVIKNIQSYYNGTNSSIASLFENFLKLNDPNISRLISSIPFDFSTIVSETRNKYKNEKTIRNFENNHITDIQLHENRINLSTKVKKFHSNAHTLTENVNNINDLLVDSNTKIHLSIHQPNLFAYSGVFKKLVFLQMLKQMLLKDDPFLKIVNLFVIIDNDFLNNIWTRTAQLPSINHNSGIFELKLPFNNNKRWKTLNNIPKPNEALLHRGKSDIVKWIRDNSDNMSPLERNKLVNNFKSLWKHVEISFEDSKNYADFNSFIISRITNLEFEYDTLFVRLTDIIPLLENGYRYILSNAENYTKSIMSIEFLFKRNEIPLAVSSNTHIYAPFWINCECGGKSHSIIEKNITKEDKDVDEIKLSGTCLSCKNKLEINITRQENISDRLARLSPRAIPIMLLLKYGLDFDCLASGTGGSIKYTAISSKVFNDLSIKMPDVFIWPAGDKYIGIGQKHAEKIKEELEVDVLDEHIRILRYKEDEYKNKIFPKIEEREKIFRNDVGKFTELEKKEILEELFILKEEQRTIRKRSSTINKIRNCLALKPCIIDYAVNLGIKQIEHEWSEKLVSNNDLTKPVYIN